jgi:hypothetical protein
MRRGPSFAAPDIFCRRSILEQLNLQLPQAPSEPYGETTLSKFAVIQGSS